MKVLLANSTCKVGGVSTFMLALRTALLSQGHPCELFFFGRGTMEAFLPSDGSVHFGTLSDCLELVDRGRFDVVHANNVDWATGISAVREIGAKLVLTAHKARQSAWTYGWNAGNCDALTAVSRWVAAELQPSTDTAIQVVLNGIDVGRFCAGTVPATSPPIVAWIGRGGSPLKGLAKLASIAPALHRGGVRLWIIDQHGADVAGEAFPDEVAALRPFTAVWNGVPYERMPDLYREVAASGGCLLSTSVREGLPLTLLEAQACGCVVVASDVPGNNECVFSDHGGVLFPFEMDGDRIAALVLDLLRDRDALVARQAIAARHVRGRFSLAQMATRYLQIYEESPYPPAANLVTRVRARVRLSPMLHYRDYLAQRWGVGCQQYETSRELAESGHDRLAAGAARASLRTSPTLFVKSMRLAHLVKVQLHQLNRALRPDITERART